MSDFSAARQQPGFDKTFTQGESEPAPPSSALAPASSAPAPMAELDHQPAPGLHMPSESKARPIPRINIQAFCEDARTADVLARVGQDRRLARTHMTVQMGGIQAATAYYGSASTPNVIVIESLHKRDQVLAEVDRLAEVCDPGTKVVVIGHVNDVLLYRELLHRGVSEYLVAPLSLAQFLESLSNLYNDPAAGPVGSVIAFVGAKGGTGSSTVCHNTAWAMSELVRNNVVIADFDLPFGTAGLDFNQDPLQGIGDALFAPDRFDDMVLDRLLSRCSDHLSLFASPGTLDQSYDLNAESCETVLEVLRRNVPYIAVDVPHLWTDWAKAVLMHSDRIVLTAAPDLANLRNAKNLLDKLKANRPNDRAPHLVLNQAGMPKRPEIPAKDFAASLDMEVDALIEFDAQLFGTAANNGQMVEEVSAKAKAAEQFRALALELCGRTEQKPEKSSLLAPILSKLNIRKAGKSGKSAKTGK
ncbi:MAG: CpaE family protein [Hyphomicrobiales bacterium]